MFYPFYQLYLFQLENYESNRFLPLLFKKGYFGSKTELRSRLVWTSKAKLIFGLSMLLVLLPAVWLASFTLLAGLFWLILSLILLPFLFLLTNVLIKPFDILAKRLLAEKAKALLSNRSNLKVIGIAGSYGKTSLKNTLATILSTKLNVLATPESVNTPTGISAWLISSLTPTTDVVIIEMGEHYRGDIDYLCRLFKPEIAILNGINEAHAERLGGLSKAIETLFEILTATDSKTQVFLNADDKNVIDNYQKFSRHRDIAFFGSRSNPKIPIKINKSKFDPQRLAWQANIDNLGEVTIHMLGRYALANVLVSTMIAKSLGLSESEIKRGISQLRPTSHRLEPIKGNGDILIVDDSYNSSPDGAAEAIEVLNRFPDRRKIYITPGIVELGRESQEQHQAIGSSLAKAADLVILIKNSVTPFIAKGLIDAGFDKKKIIWFETAPAAHKSLTKIIKNGDLVMFQNDWGDQYL